MTSSNDFTRSPEDATRSVLLVSVPLTILMFVLYGLAAEPRASGPNSAPTFHWALLGLATVAGLFIHEGLHALGWVLFGRLPLGRVRFGFVLRTLSPYAHALDPMPAGAYRVAALLPALLLGIIPYLGGLFVASAPLALFGAIFTLAAGADILVVWLIRKVDRHTKVLDHPSRVGCVVVGEGT